MQRLEIGRIFKPFGNGARRYPRSINSEAIVRTMGRDRDHCRFRKIGDFIKPSLKASGVSEETAPHFDVGRAIEERLQHTPKGEFFVVERFSPTRLDAHEPASPRRRR